MSITYWERRFHLDRGWYQWNSLKEQNVPDPVGSEVFVPTSQPAAEASKGNALRFARCVHFEV